MLQFLITISLLASTCDLSLARAAHFVIASSSEIRQYYTPVTRDEEADITYIVTTLADKPLAKLLFYKSSLEYAGEKVNHVHPLRFLMTIFSDEQLKVGIRNIRQRGWVWADMIEGMGDSLKEERERNNLTNDQIADFASVLNIDPTLIEPAIARQQWEELVDLLIAHIPREGDFDRYDW